VSSDIAFDGARGSNAGDQFHELWALQQALSLLKPNTFLKAISVEGVRADPSKDNEESPTWDGVDCTLYFGGASLETADRIEFIQLKYSASDPNKNWSTSRLIENTKKVGNNSVFRKLADDFKNGVRKQKPGASLTSKLVSNQNLSPQTEKAITQYLNGGFSSLSRESKEVLKKLQTASGLSGEMFKKFISSLDFSECGHDSRFKLRKKVVEAVEELISDSALSDTKHLQYEIRELMMPESNNELVTVKDVLLWFGISSPIGLFPCPPTLQVPEHLVERIVAKDVIDKLSEGNRLVLVHGEGGCGKTTLLYQIQSQLPKGSTCVFFDCFGGGR
jgi:hypothetical protein